ncbi:MAG: energy transducer TonB [Saccharospirillum sp.]|uniref:energy transducer TonB n=1 Tax=Saccharospirillum sp. TaxID=2033801 RepID=UPI00329A7417
MRPVWPVAITLSVMAHAALISWLPGQTPTYEPITKNTISLDLQTAQLANGENAPGTPDQVKIEQKQPPIPSEPIAPNPITPATHTPLETDVSPVSVEKPEQVTQVDPLAEQEQEQEQEQVKPIETAVNSRAPLHDRKPLATDSNASEQATDNVDTQQLQRDIKVWLKQSLAEHLHYPPVARRRGWEDSVEVTIEMQSDGAFTVEILTPAQRSIFDDAALAALADISASSRYCCAHSNSQLELTIGFQLD